MNASTARPRWCVLMTSFNRRELTLACLRSLEENRALVDVDLHAVLVDDGSRDDTADAVRSAHPWVRVLHGDGGLYWCRGMHLAFEAALADGHDAYIWLNDDTQLVPDALRRLRDCEWQLRTSSNDALIVVGSTVDAASGELTYGGERIEAGWKNRLRVQRVAPTTTVQRCDSMNGNIVLVNAEAAARVGNLDPAYEHAMGDTDYALRASRCGVPVWLAPGVHGSCSGNPRRGTYRDRSLTLAQRWRRMRDRKGLPWRSWLHFTRRHTGWLWPMYFAWPYLRLVLDAARPRLRS